MGIFDRLFNPQDAAGAGQLAAAFALLGQRGFGNAGLAGLRESQGFADRQSALKAQSLQERMQQMQMDALQRQQQDEEDMRGAIRGSVTRPTLPPTMDNRDVGQPGEMPLTPSFDMQKYATNLANIGSPAALQAFQALQKSGPELKSFDPTHDIYQGDKLVKKGAPKGEKGTSDMQNYAAVLGQGYKGTFQDFLREQANLKAPRTNVTVPVNMGQKGYENESRLRNDFKSEPIYKDFQDMSSAYKQIKAGIAQGSPIGDVAAATKMMKLLDPGSVVRESELGIAMAAGGRMDRMRNYLQMQMSGEKLTPQMRQEFSNLADELMSAAGQAYNAKRSEYATFGKTYGLNEGVLGAGYQQQAPQGPSTPSMADIDAEIARRNKGK